MPERIEISRDIAASPEFSKQMSGVEDRTARNRETMSTTLERLAAAVEG